MGVSFHSSLDLINLKEPPFPPSHENFGQSPFPPSSPPHSHFTPRKPHHPFSGFHRKPKQEKFSKEPHPYHSEHPVSYPPMDTHHSLHSPLSPFKPTVLIQNKIDEFHSHNPHHPPHRYTHMLHSIFDENGDNFVVSHHYPPVTSQHDPPPIKPASDPSYPNSGYYPKDILTRVTFIPNIYNSMMKSPLFNVNLDNTLESLWKPSQGGPPNWPFPFSDSTAHSKIDMPRYAYLSTIRYVVIPTTSFLPQMTKNWRKIICKILILLVSNNFLRIYRVKNLILKSTKAAKTIF